MNRWQGKWRNSWDSWHVHPQKDKEGVANKKQGESDHWPRILSPYLRLYHPVSARIVSMAPFFSSRAFPEKKKNGFDFYLICSLKVFMIYIYPACL